MKIFGLVIFYFFKNLFRLEVKGEVGLFFSFCVNDKLERIS